MCRLFGCRTAAPGGVAHELLHGANALRVQSREHPDGWGLGWYVGRVPQVVRSLTAAHGDEDFEEVSSFVTASTILAHIRKASIGRVAVDIVVRTCGAEAATTFLATDGRTMLACRRGRTLYVSAAEPERDRRVAWFAVASEDPRLHEPVPAGRSAWREVRAGTIVGVDAD